jgi:hypothetical protein
MRSRIARAFLQLRLSEEGSEVLSAVSMSEPVASDYRRDYSRLEKLGLERFVVMSN